MTMCIVVPYHISVVVWWWLVIWFVALHGTRHASCCRGLHPADAELRYLDHVRRLDTYGVDMHCATVRVRPGWDKCVCVCECVAVQYGT